MLVLLWRCCCWYGHYIFRCILGLNFTINDVCILLPVLLNATGNSIKKRNIYRFLNNLHFIIFIGKLIYTDRLLSARKTNRFVYSLHYIKTHKINNSFHIVWLKKIVITIPVFINIHETVSLFSSSLRFVVLYFIKFIYGAKVYSYYVSRTRTHLRCKFWWIASIAVRTVARHVCVNVYETQNHSY